MPPESDIQITSRDNPHVKRAKAVRDGKDKTRIFIEGVRLSEEALKAGVPIEECLFWQVSDADIRLSNLLDEVNQSGIPAFEVSERILRDISDTESPQGIVLIARRPGNDKLSVESTDQPRFWVILHRVNNPSNVGAIIRAAEAAAVNGLICTRGTADFMSPKALRASMGSAFRLRAMTGVTLPEAIDFCRAAGVRTFSTSARATKSYTDVDWRASSALLIGPESVGLSEDEVLLSDDSIRIPMAEPVESLNAAVAAAVVLFEAARQRTAKENLS